MPALDAFFPQQRKLMGSSAQISSGVRRCGLQAQVPEGSGGFRKVPVCAGAGSGGMFRRVSEGAGGFQKVSVLAEVAGAKVRKVWGGLGRFRGRFRRVKGQAQVLEGFASLRTKQCTHVQI